MFDTMHYEERAPAAAEMNVSSFLPTTKEGEINAAGLGNVHFFISLPQPVTVNSSHPRPQFVTPSADAVKYHMWKRPPRSSST